MIYADPDQLLRSGVRAVFMPREVLPLDRWCDKHRVLATEGTGAARSGRWDTDQTPYLREPLRRLHDPEVREVAFWKSAQVGFTDGYIVNPLLHLIGELRQPAMVVYPTADKGVAVNRRRLLPTVKACPVTARLISRAHELTQNELRIGNVPIWFGFSKSSDSLRGDPVGWIFADEIDAFDNTDNDTLAQCRSRQTTFADRKLIKGSTPEDEAGIIAEYKTADVRWRFMVPCPFTGEFFELWSFDQLHWFGGLEVDPLTAAAQVFVKSPFSPPNETFRIREHLKRWMVMSGLWVTQNEAIESDGSILATVDRDTGAVVAIDGVEKGIGRLTSDFFRSPEQEPDRVARDGGMAASAAAELRERLGIKITGHRDRGPNHGFRVNSLVSLIDAGGWAQTAADFVRAKGKPEPTWWKERLGQVPTAQAERLELTQLRALCLGRAGGGHEHGELPEWTKAVFGGVDVQQDCIKATVWAFGAQGANAALCMTARIERDKRNFLREKDLRFALRDMALVLLPTAQRVKPMGWFIDSGHFTEEVYELVRWLRSNGARAWACKGTDRDGNGRMIWSSTVTETRLPDGRREARPDPIDLIHYADDSLSSLLVSRIAADPALADLDPDEIGEELILAGRAYLPGLNGWVDQHGEPMGERVLDELTNIERVTIGAGSGLSGADGRGRRRQVWRKRVLHRANDWFDASKLAWVGLKRYQVDRWTAGTPAAPVTPPRATALLDGRTQTIAERLHSRRSV